MTSRDLSWLVQEEEDNTILCSSDDSDSEVLEFSDHCSETEVESDIEMSSVGCENIPVIYGKDKKYAWRSHPPSTSGRTKKCNIVTNEPGVNSFAKNAQSPLECWQLYFPDEILNEIVNHTNSRLDQMRSKYNRERDVLATSLDEIKSLYGLLYIAGVLKSSHLNVEDLWATDGTAPECFRFTMRYNRFYILLRALRFDDHIDREERKKINKLAPKGRVFDYFSQRCEKIYRISMFATVDEMLESFCGGCSFRQ